MDKAAAERQVIVTWYKPEEKLPPEDEYVVITFSGRRNINQLYIHALGIGVYYQGDGWLIDGMDEIESDFMTIEAWGGSGSIWNGGREKRPIDADELEELWTGISPGATVHPDSVIDTIKRAKTMQEPCEDAISRSETIKYLNTNMAWYDEDGEMADSDEKLKAITDLINGVPSVTPSHKKNDWIPCSERLPEDRREVLVTAYWHETYQVMMASYFGDGLWWCVPFNNSGEHTQRLKPKAWMPLPEPYKAEMESEE